MADFLIPKQAVSMLEKQIELLERVAQRRHARARVPRVAADDAHRSRAHVAGPVHAPRCASAAFHSARPRSAPTTSTSVRRSSAVAPRRADCSSCGWRRSRPAACRRRPRLRVSPRRYARRSTRPRCSPTPAQAGRQGREGGEEEEGAAQGDARAVGVLARGAASAARAGAQHHRAAGRARGAPPPAAIRGTTTRHRRPTSWATC